MSFKDKCPRRLECYPNSPCKNALKQIHKLQKSGFETNNVLTKEEMESPKNGGLEPCPWYIIDEEANFCFWAWHSNPLNQKEFNQEMISVFLGTSTANVHNCEKNAINKAKKRLNSKKIFQNLIKL